MLDRPHSLQAEQVGENPFHHPAVGEHVGDAAGHSQIIFQHHKFAAGRRIRSEPDDRDVDIARDLQSAHLPAKVFTAVNHFARNHSLGKNAAFVVDVAQEKIQRRDPLGKPTFDEVPLGAGDQRGRRS